MDPSSNVTAEQVTSAYDLRGRHAMVTDAGGPLGWPVAKALALADATVLVTDPDPDRAARVAHRLRAEVEGSTVLPAQLDLNSVRSALRLATEYGRTAQPLAILALCEADPPSLQHRRTTDGFEAAFGRRLGQVALTTQLLPALRQAATARVVTVAGVGATTPAVDLADPNFLRHPYDASVAYAQGQTAGCLFAAAMTQHYAAEGITCNAVDPGWRPVLNDPQILPNDVAAAPLVWGAVAAELDAVSGRLLVAPEVVGPLPTMVTPALALQWWELAEQLIRSVPDGSARPLFQ